MYTIEQTTDRVADQTVLPLTLGGPYTEISVEPTQITGLDTVAYVDIRADGQYVNDNSYNVMHSEYLKISLNGVDSQLIRPMGANWDHVDHYARFTLARIWLPPAGLTASDVLTLTVVCYAASTAAQPGDTVSVKYIDVQATVFRNA